MSCLVLDRPQHALVIWVFALENACFRRDCKLVQRPDVLRSRSCAGHGAFIQHPSGQENMMPSMQISCVYCSIYHCTTPNSNGLDENAAIVVSFLLFPGSRSPGSLGHLLDGQHLFHLCLCQSWLPSWSSGGPQKLHLSSDVLLWWAPIQRQALVPWNRKP